MICHDIEADIEKMHSTEEPDTVSDRSLVGYGIGSVRTRSDNNVPLSEEGNIPGVMFASSGSGCGKTAVTTAFLEVMKRRKIRSVSFKCGPDYIDPMFHKKVLGIESLNLDAFFASGDHIRDTVFHCDGDMAVIEGVMGLYDGISVKNTEGSCYDIARITNIPIVLILDCKGAGRTVISLIKGILYDDEAHLIKGIILNRMSASYYGKLLPVLKEEIGRIRDDVRIAGYIPNDKAFTLEGRHLGLTFPDELPDIRKKISDMADILEKGCEIDIILKIAEEAGKNIRPGISEKDMVSPEVIPESDESPLYLAVAEDEAFCFYYAENLRLFEKYGVKIRPFSPVRDKALPEGVSGILIGGGYPELHLKELSGNTSMSDSLKKAIESGMPSLAECGGFMYLHESVEDIKGEEYRLTGVIPGKCFYTGHLVNFGYVSIEGCRESGGTGEAFTGMRGHEFHYYDSTSNGNDMVLTKPVSGKKYEAMHAGDGHLWGFPHLYYPSASGAIEEFILKMKEYSL